MHNSIDFTILKKKICEREAIMSIQRLSFHPLLYFMTLTLLVCSILTGTGIWVYMLSLPSVVPPSPIQMGTIAQPQIRSEAEAITTRYMHAFLTHQYSTMWSLLHPQVRATWKNEESFAH